MLIGVISIVFAMYGGNFFELILWTSTFYMPIVTVPFIMSIFGFRSSSKSVLIGMGAGFVVVVIWELLIKDKMGNVGGLIPGMLANLTFLVSHHYLFKQEGGWVDIKNQASFIAGKIQKRQQLKSLWKDIISFNFLDACKKNTPKNEVLTSLFGLFIMVSTFFSISTIPKESQMQYNFLIDIFYLLTLCSATVLIGYPLWASRWKETNVMAICWNIIIFFVLICFNFLIVLISNFSEVQLILFMVNILMVSSLINWRWSLFYIVFGVCITLFLYERYLLSYQIQSGLSSLKFKIIYLLLLVSGILIIFLKPKQEYLEATEQKARNAEKEAEYTKRELQNILQGFDFLENQLKQKEGRLEEKEKYLRDQLKLRNREIIKLTDIKDEFLRNVEHEFNTPLTGVLSLCDVVYSCYDKLDETMIKRSMKDIVNSGDRLKTYINSIIDVSKLSAAKCELKKEDINLSKLAKDRPTLYKKIFPDETEKQEFIFDIEDNIIVNCDEYYITQVIDNLISNAVSYGKGNPITISLKKTKENKVRFDITDQGIGIPETELLSIFTKFKVSSKTWTPAGGRGVGLALCQSAIEAHGGTISAESKEDKGSTFTFILVH